MARSNQLSPGISLALLISRIVFGAYFALAGWNKIKPTLLSSMGSNLSSFAERVANDAYLPRVLGLGYGYAIPFLEIAAGALLIIGVFSRQAAILMAFLLATFIIGATGLSDGNKPFHANLIFLTLAILLATTGPGIFSLSNAMGGRRRR